MRGAIMNLRQFLQRLITFSTKGKLRDGGGARRYVKQHCLTVLRTHTPLPAQTWETNRWK